MDSYLGLHFPESDIPQPARDMFVSNRIRAISNVRAESVQLIPALNPLTGQITDLSRSMLRSPDPCHAEYLQNMGASASLTISLIKDGRLWGIITCHHQTAKFVSYELRNACELLGQVIFVGGASPLAPVGIFQTDIAGDCLFINQQGLELMGASQAEILGRGWANSIHPDDRPRVFAAWESTVVVNQRFGWEFRMMTPQGQVNWVSGNALAEPIGTIIAIEDEAGNITGYLGTLTDITEKKRLEQQFLRAQRLESLGTLASGIAHDLNNVLTPIVGAAQLLQVTLPTLDERNQRLLTMLVSSSLRGSSLVKQILTFARGVDGQRTVLKLQHILVETIDIAHQTFPKSIEISLDLLLKDLQMVCVDATQIHQVFMNLFVNARDALPHGGSITATATNLVIEFLTKPFMTTEMLDVLANLELN